jgi:hypothetical protein
MMKIECKLKRAGGTVAELEGVEYHFAPQDDGAHVVEIENVEHIERFLSIPSAYCIYGVSRAPAGAGRRSGRRGSGKTRFDGDINGDGVVDDKDERAALAAAFTEKFGKAPHHKLSIASLKAKLAE